MLRGVRSRLSIYVLMVRITHNSRSSAKRKVNLQAKYIARWAQSFLGLDESVVTSIPIGDVAHLSADGRFRLVIPDLSQDPLAGTPDHPGELQVWAKDETSDAIV